MSRSLLLSFTLLLLTTTARAQNLVQLTIPDTTTNTGSTICLPIIVDSFPSIASAQFSLGWDTLVITYSSIEFGSNPLGLIASDVFLPNSDVLNVSWFTPDGMGVTIAPGSTLFEVCFLAADNEGSTDVVFGAGLPAEFVQEGIFMPTPTALFNGSISVVATENLSVLPGDTNLDSLVNADDILNIGLGFNDSGPARMDAQTDFNFQEATPWQTTTPTSIVDYAHLDADGNGLIDALDADIVLANYGEDMLSLQDDDVSTTSGSSQMPFIFTSTDPIQGGQLSSIQVFLGDDANPVGPGYGLSFAVQFSPTQFDLSTISVDFNGSFLGDDLLSFAELFPNEFGLLEVAAVRKDQINGTDAGGLVCTINIQPLALAENQTASLFVTPYRYINAEEVSTNLVQAISEILILAPTSTQEPVWARDLVIAPNPSNDGLVNVIGLPNEVAMLKLSDAQGKHLANFSGWSSQLDLSSWPAGAYWLQIVSQEGVVTRRIVLGQ